MWLQSVCAGSGTAAVRLICSSSKVSWCAAGFVHVMGCSPEDLLKRYAQAFSACSATPSCLYIPTPPPAALLPHRFVDPSDPSTVYLTQPTSEEQRLNYTPAYAPNYGQDEKYEPMGLRP